MSTFSKEQEAALEPYDDGELEEYRVATRGLAILSLSAAVLTAYMAMFGDNGSDIGVSSQTYLICTLILAIVGVGTYVAGNSFGNNQLALFCMVGIIGVTAGIARDELNATALVLIYVWISLFAWYFLASSTALLLNVMIAVGYIFALSWGNVVSPERFPVHATTLMGSLAVAGFVISIGKRRISQLLATLTRLAHTDPLTGLANRREFGNRLTDALAMTNRYGSSLSVLMVDIDHFKSINDTYGHEVGDKVLRNLAAHLRDCRDTDFPARLGGEEFALILPETHEEGAAIVAERLRDRIEKADLGIERGITISIGIALYPLHAREEGALLNSADRALYIAKESGRNKVIVFDKPLDEVVAISKNFVEQDSRANLEVLLRLARLADAETSSTDRIHVIGDIASRTAVDLGVPEGIARDVRVAGALHEVGKIGMSRMLLSKVSPLTEDEWKELRSYPRIGAQIMERFGFVEIAGWIARMHDSAPTLDDQDLTEDLPIVVKILKVVDAFDAMTAHRPYRRGMTIAAAKAELQANSGTQFDASVVDAFSEVLENLSDAEIQLVEMVNQHIESGVGI